MLNSLRRQPVCFRQCSLLFEARVERLLDVKCACAMLRTKKPLKYAVWANTVTKPWVSYAFRKIRYFIIPISPPPHSCESKHFPGSLLKETSTESYPISLLYVSIIAVNFPFCDTQCGINCLEIMLCATSESI